MIWQKWQFMKLQRIATYLYWVPKSDRKGLNSIQKRRLNILNMG